MDRSNQSLEGRSAVVTGVAGGIGNAIARQLIEQGAKVHGLDRDADALRRLAQELGGERFVPYVVDLTERAHVDRVLVELLARLEQCCDILVNNAGVSLSLIHI